jgi:hypothetical protein
MFDNGDDVATKSTKSDHHDSSLLDSETTMHDYVSKSTYDTSISDDSDAIKHNTPKKAPQKIKKITFRTTKKSPKKHNFQKKKVFRKDSINF